MSISIQNLTEIEFACVYYQNDASCRLNLDETHRTNTIQKPFNISHQLNICIMGGKPNPRYNNTGILFQNPSKKKKEIAP